VVVAVPLQQDCLRISAMLKSGDAVRSTVCRDVCSLAAAGLMVRCSGAAVQSPLLVVARQMLLVQTPRYGGGARLVEL